MDAGIKTGTEEWAGDLVLVLVLGAPIGGDGWHPTRDGLSLPKIYLTYLYCKLYGGLQERVG
jgi:hypothetical protein